MGHSSGMSAQVVVSRDTKSAERRPTGPKQDDQWAQSQSVSNNSLQVQKPSHSQSARNMGSPRRRKQLYPQRHAASAHSAPILPGLRPSTGSMAALYSESRPSGGVDLSLIPPNFKSRLNYRSTSRQSVVDLSRLGTASVPRVVFRLPNLAQVRQLFLNNNHLTEMPDLSGLIHLEQLDVSENHLTSLPMGIGSLRFLVMFIANKNRVKEVPPTVSQMQSLQWFSINSNALSTIPPEIAECHELQYLGMGHNKIEKVPSVLCTLPKLRELHIYGNKIRSLPLSLASLSSLRVLTLHGNNHLRNVPIEYHQLVNLEIITADRVTMISPPAAVFRRGAQAVLRYLTRKHQAALELARVKSETGLITSRSSVGHRAHTTNGDDESQTPLSHSQSTPGLIAAETDDQGENSGDDGPTTSPTSLSRSILHRSRKQREAALQTQNKAKVVSIFGSVRPRGMGDRRGSVRSMTAFRLQRARQAAKEALKAETAGGPPVAPAEEPSLRAQSMQALLFKAKSRDAQEAAAASSDPNAKSAPATASTTTPTTTSTTTTSAPGIARSTSGSDDSVRASSFLELPQNIQRSTSQESDLSATSIGAESIDHDDYDSDGEDGEHWTASNSTSPQAVRRVSEANRPRGPSLAQRVAHRDGRISNTVQGVDGSGVARRGSTFQLEFLHHRAREQEQQQLRALGMGSDKPTKPLLPYQSRRPSTLGLQPATSARHTPKKQATPPSFPRPTGQPESPGRSRLR